MNGKQLKNSILQWAIQGKLVPQDPNDEPASILLEKIYAEKERLVKEGKLKKKDMEVKPIAEDEILFEIPKGWEWCRMQDVIEFVNGRAYKKDELLDKGKYKVLRVGNFFTNDSWYYSDLELPDEKYCYNGDLLYAWSASFGPQIWEGNKTIFHYHIWNVKYNQEVLYREYLYFFLLADKVSIKGSTTGSTMVHVSMENMKPRLIPIPPLAEQQRIVAKIEELMPLVEKYGETQEALEEWNNSLPEKLKKSILQEAIQGKLVPQDPNEGIAEISNSYKVPRKTSNFDDYLFEIPEKWKWCKLFQIADVIGGYAFQSGDLKSNNGIRVIRISDITPKGLSNKSVVRCSLREIPDQYSIKCNDILIAMTGGTVGKSLLLKSMTEPMYLNQRVAIIRASKDVDVEYLNLVIKSPLIQSIISDVKNSTNDNISMADITGFPFPLPPLAEQRRIVAKIEELFGVIKK